MTLLRGAIGLVATVCVLLTPCASAATHEDYNPPVRYVPVPAVGEILTSGSMEPTVHCVTHAEPDCRAKYPDELVLERSGARGIRRGDIISFAGPASMDRYCTSGASEIVKRVIGIGGDRIIEKNGVVFVNGRRVNDSYVPRSERDRLSGTWNVPTGSFFVMGDNRKASCDSREWGVLPARSIRGRAIAIMRPTAGGANPVGPPIVHVRFPYFPYIVATPAMEPSLRCGPADGPHCSGRGADLALFELSGPTNLHRQAVILFRLPHKAARFCGAGGAVERIIGLAGDRITESSGTIRVNGHRLREPYVPRSERDRRSGTWRVPRGSVFVMADYRARSCDSRYWGAVPLSNVEGPIAEIFRPRSP